MHGSVTIGELVLMGADIAPESYEAPKGFTLSVQIKAWLTPSVSSASWPTAAGLCCRSRKRSGPRVLACSSIASASHGRSTAKNEASTTPGGFRAVSTVIDKSKILGVRAGLRSPHRFTGIWIVVVDAACCSPGRGRGGPMDGVRRSSRIRSVCIEVGSRRIRHSRGSAPRHAHTRRRRAAYARSYRHRHHWSKFEGFERRGAARRRLNSFQGACQGKEKVESKK